MKLSLEEGEWANEEQGHHERTTMESRDQIGGADINTNISCGQTEHAGAGVRRRLMTDCYDAMRRGFCC